MNGNQIQAKVYAGYAKAASVIGVSYNLFRPISPVAPFGNQVSTLLAALDSTSSYKFKEPNSYGDPTWFALISDATTQTGDYLQNASGTYFIAGKQFLLPVILVDCNRLVRVTREAALSAVGALPYSGLNQAADTDILGTKGVPTSYWPCSILLGGRFDKAGTLPADVRNEGWKVLLPPSVPVVIKPGDILTDDLGKRYTVTGAELTDLGFRMTAQEAHT